MNTPEMNTTQIDPVDMSTDQLPLPLILASTSPRRRELLERLGIPVQIKSSDVDEVGSSAELPGEEVSRQNARLKAEAVASLTSPGHLVLAADTEVVLDGHALGKPATPLTAFDMLRRLSGRTHQVLTAFVLLEIPATPATPRRIEQVITTEVTFKTLTDAEIWGYIETGEPFDKAGGYGIQGIGAFLVRKIHGSYTNVVGLPLTEVLDALHQMGGPQAFQKLDTSAIMASNLVDSADRPRE